MMKKTKRLCSISIYSTDDWNIPHSLFKRIHSHGFAFADVQSCTASSGTPFFTEILFVYCSPRQEWRFMGVSVNYLDPDVFDGQQTEEIASSIFRENPTEEIDAPWSCIFAFCETALCSRMGRVVSPFVRLAKDPSSDFSILVPLRAFNYQTMNWSLDVSPFSKPA